MTFNKNFLFLFPFLILEGFFPIFAFFAMQKVEVLFVTALALFVAFIILAKESAEKYQLRIVMIMRKNIWVCRSGLI
jgi:hypothetical protein